MRSVPSSLRTWFTIHFWVDLFFGLPLFIAPTFTLTMFGFTTIEPLTARIVASAFLAIGTTSLLTRNKSKETYDALLTLKIIWSSLAMLGVLLSIIEGTTIFAWGILATYFIFFCVWVYYKRKL